MSGQKVFERDVVCCSWWICQSLMVGLRHQRPAAKGSAQNETPFPGSQPCSISSIMGEDHRACVCARQIRLLTTSVPSTRTGRRVPSSGGLQRCGMALPHGLLQARSKSNYGVAVGTRRYAPEGNSFRLSSSDDGLSAEKGITRLSARLYTKPQHQGKP